MKVGVMMHCTDLVLTPAELAIAAEERGFESLFVTEHTHIPVRPFIAWRGGRPMPEEYKRLYDPIVALATAAAATHDIRLGTGVLVIGQREPLATAKQLATLDRLSGGRLICGIGYGWQADELAQHGITIEQRSSALREHLAAVRALWTQAEATFVGERVRFGPSWSYPKPLQSSPKVLLGAAGSEANLLDVVQQADGWMPIEGTEPIELGWRRLRELSELHGRDPSTLELVIFGSAGGARTLALHRDAGATRVVLGIAGGDRDEVLRQLDVHTSEIEEFRAEP